MTKHEAMPENSDPPPVASPELSRYLQSDLQLDHDPTLFEGLSFPHLLAQHACHLRDTGDAFDRFSQSHLLEPQHFAASQL